MPPASLAVAEAARPMSPPSIAVTLRPSRQRRASARVANQNHRRNSAFSGAAVHRQPLASPHATSHRGLRQALQGAGRRIPELGIAGVALLAEETAYARYWQAIEHGGGRDMGYPTLKV